MPEFNRYLARQIVRKALARYSHLSEDAISDQTQIDSLRLSDAGKVAVAQEIRAQIEGLGLRTRFSRLDLLRAHTVGDLIQETVTGTDSGGPKYQE
jgi:hypothetical protein